MKKKESLPIIRGLLLDVIDYAKLIEMQANANERVYNPKFDVNQNKRPHYGYGQNNGHHKKTLKPQDK